MENKMKAATLDVIRTLSECNVRQIMATGDNVLTAISVARQSNIVHPLKEIILGELQFDSTFSKPKLKWSS